MAVARRTLLALSGVLVLQFISLTTARRASCTGNSWRHICKDLSSDTSKKYLIENVKAFHAADLSCLKEWSQTKDQCKYMLEELIRQLKGKTTSMLHIQLDQHKKLAEAVGLEIPDDPPKLQRVRPVSAAKPKPSTEGNSSGPPDKVEVSGPSNIDTAQCMCGAGTRGVNLAGLGVYSKDRKDLKGPDGGPCNTDCDKCNRVDTKGDRFICCQVTIDGQKGKCGKEFSAPKYNGEKCMCDGHMRSKESLACLPDTPCKDCKEGCVEYR